MFIRIKRSVHDNKVYEYLQIVKSVRKGKKVQQKVIANLGKRDEFINSGELDKLIESMARFSTQLRLIQACEDGGIDSCKSKSWGPALVFDRLWKRQGLPEIIQQLSSNRRFRFDVERVCFALALQRLVHPGSDLSGS